LRDQCRSSSSRYFFSPHCFHLRYTGGDIASLLKSFCERPWDHRIKVPASPYKHLYTPGRLFPRFSPLQHSTAASSFALLYRGSPQRGLFSVCPPWNPRDAPASSSFPHPKVARPLCPRRSSARSSSRRSLSGDLLLSPLDGLPQRIFAGVGDFIWSLQLFLAGLRVGQTKRSGLKGLALVRHPDLTSLAADFFILSLFCFSWNFAPSAFHERQDIYPPAYCLSIETLPLFCGEREWIFPSQTPIRPPRMLPLVHTILSLLCLKDFEASIYGPFRRAGRVRYFLEVGAFFSMFLRHGRTFGQYGGLLDWMLPACLKEETSEGSSLRPFLPIPLGRSFAMDDDLFGFFAIAESSPFSLIGAVWPSSFMLNYGRSRRVIF